MISKYSESRALLAHSSAENIFLIVWKYINLIIDKSICERAIEAWPAHHSVFSKHRMPQGVKNEKSMQSLWDSEMDLWGITGWSIRKKNIIWTTMWDYKDRSCRVQEGPRQNMYNVIQDALNPLHLCFWVSCATIPALGISKIPSPCLCPQEARRYLLHEILQFSHHNLRCGAASTGLLVGCNSSLTEIKIIIYFAKRLQRS